MILCLHRKDTLLSTQYSVAGCSQVPIAPNNAANDNDYLPLWNFPANATAVWVKKKRTSINQTDLANV